MCGILITKRPVNPGVIGHRGTEVKQIGFCNTGQGTQRGLILTHTRLPIQTVGGDKWGQPIQLQDGGYLLYNGEIFNCPDWYQNDVEYLWDLFNHKTTKEAADIANRWDGFWAIVRIHPNGVMEAFTDPLGKKQLYYNSLGEICSEIRPIVPDLDKFNPVYRSQVMKWGYHIGNETPWLDVNRVIPGHIHFWNTEGKVTVEQSAYFRWQPLEGKPNLEQLMFDAVLRRVQTLGEHRPGVLLSGGLDSSIVADFLASFCSRADYYYIDNEEGKYAQEMAQRLDVELIPLEYNPEEANLEDIYKWNETPIDLGSVVPQHLLMEATAKKGNRVVFTGDGADELFGGYSRAKEYDSQHSDIFDELPYYHLPRLDRASMRYTVELRNPFLSHDIVRYALFHTPRLSRINKSVLRGTFGRYLPSEITWGKKRALKNPVLRKDPLEWRKKVDHIFYEQGIWKK